MKFGTDGIRGVANQELTPELALSIGRASARVLGGSTMSVGRDPRWSGPMLEAAFVAGVLSEGVSVEVLGVVPTPAVAFRSQQAGAPAAMISASHNPFGDNGIKLFAAGGLKLDDAVQNELEGVLAEIRSGKGSAVDSGRVPVGGDLGDVSSFDVSSLYLDHLLGAIGSSVDRPLAGMNVVLDCAHGASSALAGPLFERAGAAVTVLNCAPNGTNINDACGSTHPERLQAAVVELGADLGCAFDGDADRMLAVDATGRLIDGDQLIALCAIDLKSRGRLAHDTVVVTVMSNLGFRQGMARAGIGVRDTAVGDRYVLEALDSEGFNLGGEQSGHIILRDFATTGDGLLSALLTSEIVARSDVGLAALADAAMTRLPQVLVNVRIQRPMPDVADRIASEIAEVEGLLGADGRVLVRPSGTEPVVRIMVEAVQRADAEKCAAQLSHSVEQLS